jgi:hypothetical protein
MPDADAYLASVKPWLVRVRPAVRVSVGVDDGTYPTSVAVSTWSPAGSDSEYVPATAVVVDRPEVESEIVTLARGWLVSESTTVPDTTASETACAWGVGRTVSPTTIIDSASAWHVSRRHGELT